MSMARRMHLTQPKARSLPSALAVNRRSRPSTDLQALTLSARPDLASGRSPPPRDRSDRYAFFVRRGGYFQYRPASHSYDPAPPLTWM